MLSAIKNCSTLLYLCCTSSDFQVLQLESHHTDAVHDRGHLVLLLTLTTDVSAYSASQQTIFLPVPQTLLGPRGSTFTILCCNLQGSPKYIQQIHVYGLISVACPHSDPPLSNRNPQQQSQAILQKKLVIHVPDLCGMPSFPPTLSKLNPQQQSQAILQKKLDIHVPFLVELNIVNARQVSNSI